MADDEKVSDKPMRPALRPTVIGELRGRSDAPKRKASPAGGFGPTVIASPGEARPRRRETSEAPPPRSAGGPTTIPGIERKRIAVSTGDLRKLAPQASSRTAEQALRQIGMFVAESASERQVILWGHDAQRRYSGLASRAVELSQTPVLARAAGYLNRMIELLSLIDVEAACGAASGGGMLDRVLRRANARIDTPEELEAARAEIDQLVGLTGAALEDLLALRQKLNHLREEIGETADEIKAAALAAHFLSEHLREQRDDLARRFLERSMSLTQSLAQLSGGAEVAAAQAEQPLRLIAAIQDVALVALPGLLGSFAALNSVARSARPTPTEAREVAYRLRDVLGQLKS